MKKNIFSIIAFWLSIVILHFYINIQRSTNVIAGPAISNLVNSLVKVGLSSIICYIIIGFVLLFISQTKKKKNLLILDLLFIDIPCLILVGSTLFILAQKNIFAGYLWVNRSNLTIHGALFLSCEICRYFEFLKKTDEH